MSTQQYIYAAGFENCPPMLNKENYIPWSSRLLRYAKSRPNGKLIYNSIMNGLYVRRMIPEPGDASCEVLVLEKFHKQTNDELTKAEIKQMEADDQAIQTILLGLPEDIYAAVDSCKAAQEIWLHVQQMMKGSDIGIQEKKAKLFNEWERWLEEMEGISLDRIANQNRNGNVVAARAEGNANGNNVRPRRRDVVYLQTQFQIAQKEEAIIQLQAEDFDLMVDVADLDEIEEVNGNCILMANLQQPSTSGTQSDKALVYNSSGSAEVHLSRNCYDNDVFNMFTQEEQYTKLLEPIPVPH
ncbi:hypothetical protein Tco_1155660 [Tanacetum coccineum]